MRGEDQQQPGVFSYISPEQRVPKDHPLRAIRKMVDEALREMSPLFAAMYARVGRPSIAPEKLLRALLLQVLYTVRSERQLMEQLDYNMLFRWFVGLNMDDPIWDATVFTKNRERLLEADAAKLFFQQILAQAERKELLSLEHFTVDGTLVEAWAGQKSFQRKKAGKGGGPPGPGGSNPEVDFRGEKRSNQTHESTTDPQARLYKKSNGTEAKLSYLGHVLMDNRHGLAVDGLVSQATGRAEWEASEAMVAHLPRSGPVTVGGDKNYDVVRWVEAMRELGATPHVARKNRYSAIDGRTARHDGYLISQRKRKLIEQIFGWLKTVGGLRKTRHRGKDRVDWMFAFGLAAYNLVRMRNLTAEVAA
jgi:transposase